MNDTQEPYMIDDAGKLFRKGEEIGKLEGDQLTLKPEAKNYQASVTRWLREKADEAETAPTPEPEAPKKRLTPAEQEEADNKGIAKEAQEEAAKARALSKTPAFVEWLNNYRPDEYIKRYNVKGKGKVPVIVTNPETGIDEVTGYRDADMATRKTHLTEKLESNRGIGEDMDWNA